MTPYMWHLTPDMWYVTYDTWFGIFDNQIVFDALYNLPGSNDFQKKANLFVYDQNFGLKFNLNKYNWSNFLKETLELFVLSCLGV